MAHPMYGWRTCSGKAWSVYVRHRRFFITRFAVLDLSLRLSRSIEAPGVNHPPPRFPCVLASPGGKAHLSRKISPDISPAREMSPMRFDISSCVWMGCSLCSFLLSFSLPLLSLSLSLSPSLPRSTVWFMGSPDICLSMPTWGRVDDPRRRAARTCTAVYMHAYAREPRFSIHYVFHFDPSPRRPVIGRNRRPIEN